MGLGHAGIQRLSEGMGMPGIHHSSYNKYVDEIFPASKEIADVILTVSREKVVSFYRDNQEESFEDGVLNLPVSFDGSWPKRGHTSKLGFGAAIDVKTGLVVDFHVMSLYCQVCAQSGEKIKKRDPEEYAVWLQQHEASGQCMRNFHGTSGAMEVEAALVLWRRSLDHGMRYVTLVGDADMKTFSALLREQPYGLAHPVQKEECVNHVSRRLNTDLRTLKSTLSKQSVRIGGNAKGSLSDPKIGLLQSYYTKAVRSNNASIEEMSVTIWAAFHHSTGKHDQCPRGEDSWCWFQRDLSRGILQPELGARKQSTFLNELVASHVQGVYKRSVWTVSPGEDPEHQRKPPFPDLAEVP